MWGIALFCLLFGISSGLGHSITDSTKISTGNAKTVLNYLRAEPKVDSFFDELTDWDSLAADQGRIMGQTTTLQPVVEDGRKLKHKKAEIKFMMKTLLLFKVILGLLLPLGIISSKILSWKAVTLSLMAFMLAKILFVKNLLTGKNAFSVTPANFVPPVFIHGGSNDAFWKRQGDVQAVYPWGST